MAKRFLWRHGLVLLLLVLAQKSFGWDWDPNWNWNLLFPPGVPPALTISETTSHDGNWRVSWGIAANNEKGYAPTSYVLEESAGGSWGEVYRGSNRYFDVSGKKVNGDYFYRVKACTYVCSAFTAAKKVKLDYREPSTLSLASNSGTGNYSLSWSVPSTAPLSYVISTTHTVKLQWRPGTSGNWQTLLSNRSIGKLGHNESYSRSNEVPGTYQYRLIRRHVITVPRRCHHAGCPPYPIPFTTTTATTETHKEIKVGKPGKPPSLSSPTSVTTGTGVTISWGAASNNPQQYHLQQAKGSGGYETVYQGAGRSQHFNLSPATYRYRVRACRGGWEASHCSDWRTQTGTTTVSMATPARPTLSNKSGLSDGEFIIRWSSVPYATEYRVFRATAAQGSNDDVSGSSLVYKGAGQSVGQTLGDGNYQYSVVACRGALCSPQSSKLEVQVLFKPLIPGDLAIADKSDRTDGNYRVVWDDQNRRVTRYDLLRATAPYSGNYGTETTISNTTSRSVSQSNGDGKYRYRVRACNEAGCSGYTDYKEATVLVLPEVPDNFRVTGKTNLDDKNYALEWNSQSKRVTHYKLQLAAASYTDTDSCDAQSTANETTTTVNQTDETTIVVSQTDETTIVVSQTNDDGNYCYSVRACNESGCSAYTASREVKVLAIPARPTGITVPTSTKGAFTATLSYGSGYVQWIDIEQSINGGTWGNRTRYNGSPALLSLMRSAYTSSGTSATYRFRVRACNDADCSTFSTASGAVSVTPPGTPNAIWRSHTSHGTVDADGGYRIHWSAVTGVSGIRYDVEERSNGGHWQRRVSGGSSTTYSISGNRQALYGYRVRACVNDIGCGGWTHELSQRVAFKPGNIGAINVPESSAKGRFSVSWNKPSGTVTHYQLMRDNTVIVANLTATSQAFGQHPDGNPSFAVRACNHSVCSNYTAAKSIKLVRTPGPPQNLRGNSQSNGAGEFSLSWSAPASGQVSHYEIITGVAPHATWGTAINNGSNTTWTFTGTEGNYNIAVRACNALSCGAAVSFTVAVRLNPTNLPAIQGPGISTTGNYRISWATASGTVTAYQLQQRATGGNWQTIHNGTARSKTLADVQAGTYQYRLKACNDGNCTAYGNPKNVLVDRYTIPTPTAPVAATDPGEPSEADTIGTVNGSFRVAESGSASYAIPISTATGTAGVAPQLQLLYNSHAANGIAGQGWSLGGLSAISRCRQTKAHDGAALPISWSDKDRFCLDGQRLVLASGNYGASGSTYKTDTDSFARITAKGGSNGHPAYFTVARKDGSISYYGNSTNAKQQGTGSQRTLTWVINRFEDSVGNVMNFVYYADEHGHRIKQINYAYSDASTANAKVVFSYGNRDDVRKLYVSGSLFTAAKRLTTISSYSRVNGVYQLLRTYKLAYQPATTGNTARLSRLKSVTECAAADVCLPPTTFSWRSPNVNFAGSARSQTRNLSLGNNNYLIDSKFADINGDGLLDIVYVRSFAKYKRRFLKKPKLKSHQNVHYLINTGSGFAEGDVTHYSDSIKRPLKLSVLDYNADGRQDIMVYRSSGWQLYLATANGSGHWSLARQTVSFPFSSRDVQFVDMNADGLVDAVDGNHYWLLQRDTAQAKTSNRAYKFGAANTVQYKAGFHQDNSANRANDLIGPAYNCQWLWEGDCDYYWHGVLSVKAAAGDLNGDGIGDLLLQRWGYQLAVSDNSTGSLVFRHAGSNAPAIGDHEVVRFADLNADGLSDVIYWHQITRRWRAQLSTGTGFGSVITLADIPAATADAAEDNALQLADINRDGFPDVTWQHNSALKVNYWNNKTQTFSSAVTLRSLILSDNYNHILMDYNGDGATDYVRFYSRQRSGSTSASFTYYPSGETADSIWDADVNLANVITSIRNGLGATTTISYERINRSDHYTPIEPKVSGCYQHCSNNHSSFNDPFGDLPTGSHTLQATPLHPVLPINTGMAIVSSIRSSAPTTANTNATSRISYYYTGARMQPAGWGSLGFKQLRTKDEQSGVLTTTTYRQDWPFNGRPWKTVVRSQQGKTLRDAENIWAIHNWNNTWPTTAKTGTAKLGSLQVYLKTATERSYALQGNGSTQGALLQTVTTTTGYDNYGNATRINSVTKNGSNTTVQTRTVSNNYGTGSYNLFHGRLQSSTAATTLNGVTHTRKSAFSYHTTGPKKGLLKTETIQPEGGKAFKLTTTHLYDNFGNKTQTTTTGWDGTATVTRQSARSEYDSTGRFINKQYQRYPGKGEQLVSKVVKRNRYGSPTQATDTNGVNAYNYYTALGRLYFATSDLGGWKKTWTGSADSLCPTGTAYTTYVEQAGGAAAKECFDVLARSTRKLSQGFDGRWIATDQSYDNFGRADISSEPFLYHQQQQQCHPLDADKKLRLTGQANQTQSPR